MDKIALLRHICDDYHILPEYPFAKYPDYAVFRHPSTHTKDSIKKGKWFCLLMSVHADKLGFSDDNYHDIINVKVQPEFTGSLLGMDGVLPAYHMNKEHWVSILIDVVNDGDIKDFIAESFELTL